MEILEELDLPTPDDLEEMLTPVEPEVRVPGLIPPPNCPVDGVVIDGKDTAELIRDRKCREATILLLRAAKRGPPKAGVFNNLGCSRYCLGDKPRAKLAFEWALKEETEDRPEGSKGKARRNLGKLF